MVVDPVRIGGHLVAIRSITPVPRMDGAVSSSRLRIRQLLGADGLLDEMEERLLVRMHLVRMHLVRMQLGVWRGRSQDGFDVRALFGVDVA